MSDVSGIVCDTMDCVCRATHGAAIFDGISDEPTIASYCDDCAGVLERGGDEVWLLHGRDSRAMSDVTPVSGRSYDPATSVQYVSQKELDGVMALRAEVERLRALLKQAHDRDRWQGEFPTIAWYDDVARYFQEKCP